MKKILYTTFIKQNSYHQYGVLLHTLKVTMELLLAKQYKMFAAGLLHDLGKPNSAHQKPEDIEKCEYSFTDHEELSYQIIKDWKFVSEYTKNLVRYHYIIRRMSKAKQKGLDEYESLNATWKSFSPEFQKDVALFMKCDDLGKGTKKFRNKPKDK